MLGIYGIGVHWAEGNPHIRPKHLIFAEECESKWNILSINSKYLKNRSSGRLSVGTLFKNSTMSANNELLMKM